jgi:hydrogenase maturation protease
MSSKSSNTKTTCIVGIGNTLRSDDGAGAYAGHLLEEKKIPGVTVIITQQLDIAMAAELATFDQVIFIDAAIHEEGISFQPLTAANNSPQSFAHHINAAMLVSLAKQLYNTATQFYVCAIRAKNFEMGNELSEKTLQHTQKAAAIISEWIVSKDAQ